MQFILKMLDRAGVMNYILKILDRVSGEYSKRDVRFDDDGFTIIHYEEQQRIQWAEVREVVGFKSDHFSIDEVCLGFRIEEAGSPVRIWVDEDDRGFKQFLPEVEKRFNIDPEWFAKVAYPAFVQNWTTLWKHV